ncbi:unnamed protein product, partial [Brenthis ino]
MPLTQTEISRRHNEKLKKTNPEKYLDMEKKIKSRAIKAYQNNKRYFLIVRCKKRKEGCHRTKTVHTIQFTSNEQPAHTQHQHNMQKTGQMKKIRKLKTSWLHKSQKDLNKMRQKVEAIHI